ncbi:hypothetical protein HUO13_34785 [Saccharopolyspora erythraea]|uniref:hypothetical protein n=1 Tax=Saccharopolyspora erythraea TaxID=1836 RepID=UPI001BA47578|nr:hypothetical protein [Saccharopolyspora erythraea]QUH05259.1 hypothetical protein HUO13_34785 [Saccharopolyspora erythraea]
MDGFWVQVLVAVVAGAVGAAASMVFAASGRRRVPGRQQRQEVPAPPPPAAPAVPPDRWLPQLQRCEQAIRRAGSAVESVSSAHARQTLNSVVQRMDAEMPHIRALVELGRGLDADAVGQEVVLHRVHQQLEDAAVRFAMFTDHVLEVVLQLVADPDMSRVHQQVTVLREQFPLLRPMSAVLAPESAPPRSLLNV